LYRLSIKLSASRKSLADGFVISMPTKSISLDDLTAQCNAFTSFEFVHNDQSLKYSGFNDKKFSNGFFLNASLNASLANAHIQSV
jgi:hypothetical protein